MKAIFLFFAGFTASVFAQNTMVFPEVSGVSNDTINVSIVINNSDSFVGFQFDLPLGDQIAFVPSSASLSDRANDHSLVETIIDNNTIRIFAYSMNQTEFSGNSGEVCSFSVVLNTVPGDYDLIPENTVIGNSNSENIITNVTNGIITIVTPDIHLPTTGLDYDRVPLLESSDLSFIIQNSGNSDLNINSLYTSLSDFEVLGDTIFTIQSGGSRTVTIRFHSNTKGTYNEYVFIESDDPDEPIQTVDLQVIAYAVNELDINDVFGRSDHISTLTIDIANMEPFTGFSFDLNLPDVMFYQSGSVVLTNRSTDHIVNANIVENSHVRVVAYSPTNSPFSGNSGNVLELDFLIDGIGGYYTINFVNPVIGDSNAVNIISDDYNGTLQIASPDINFSQTSVDFGSISIFDTSTAELTINNTGSDTLLINDILFYDNHFYTSADLPIVIEESQSEIISISFHNENSGEYISQVRFRNNDPDEDPADIELSASVFIPNIIRVDSSAIVASDSGWISVSIENNEPFVGFQFDMIIPPNLSYVNEIQLSDRAGNHTVTAFEVDSSTIRVFAYSMDQTEFFGTNGSVVQLKVLSEYPLGDFSVELDNIIIGNTNSDNIISSYENGIVTVLFSGPTLSDIPELIMFEDHDSLITTEWLGQYVTDPNTTYENLLWTFTYDPVITIVQNDVGWTISPVENWHGISTITAIVSDGVYSDSTNFTLTVNPVNDAPTIAAITDTTFNEDDSLSIVLSSTDFDEDAVTYSAFADTNAFQVSITDSLLTITANANWNGSSFITAIVSDGEYSDSTNFTLTINPVNDAPIMTAISDKSYSEDDSLGFVLTSTDIDSDDLVYSAFSDTTAISVTVSDSLISFTSSLNWNGSSLITAIVSDGVYSDSTNFTLTVNPVNDAPTIAAITDTTFNEDDSLSIVLSSTDIDGDNVTNFAFTDTNAVQVTIQGSFLMITADENWNGLSEITAVVSDGEYSDSTDFTLTVNPINDAPVLAIIGDQSSDEDTAKVIILSATDVEGDDLTYSASSAEANVTVVVSNDTLILTPVDNWNGTADITVTVTDDGTGTLTNSETFTLTVNPINDNPVLTNIGAQTVNEDTAKVVTLSATDIENDNLTFTASSAESNITATVSNDTLTLTPDENWNGTGNITVFVNDGFLSDSTSFVLTVTPVNDAPVVNDMNVEIEEDGTIEIIFSGSDIDGDDLTFAVVDAPTNGTYDGTTYTPNADYNGNDSFTYKANDGTVDSELATVTITVTSVNDEPVLTFIGDQNMNEDGSLAITLSATDVDNANLVFGASSDNADVLATIDADTLTLTASLDYNGTAQITVTVDDQVTRLTDSETFTLTVNPVNDAPIADALSVTTDEDVAVAITMTGSDADGDSLTFAVVTAPVNGTYNGTTYTPNADYNGADSFTYKANDGTVDSELATVTITVTSVNDAPVLATITAQTTNEDTALTVQLSATDADGDSLSYAFTSDTSAVTIVEDNSVLTLTPASNWNGVANISVTVSDGALTDEESFVLTVNAVNDVPTVDDLAIELEEDGSVEIPFSGFDIDGDILTYAVVDEAMHGTVTAGVYYPNANFTGIDSLSYVANDGLVNSDLGMVIITVTNMNDAPYVAQAMTDITVDEDSDTLSLSIDGVFDDLDIIHGDSLTITAVSLNTELIMIESEVPYLMFAENGNGETDIVVTATDLEGLSVNDTVHVTVNAVNDSPNEFNLTETDEVIAITLDELSTGSLDFEWEVAEDVDGDSIVYHYTSTLTAGSYTEQLDSSLVDTSLTLMTYRAIYDKLFAWEVTTAVLEWHVYSDDGTVSVPALNGPLTLSIDISSLSVDDQLIPDVFALHQNYPNPFNPTTTLQYDLPEDAKVSLVIYDIMGREVKRLVHATQEAGFNSVLWDGKNNHGSEVSAGMYLYRISAGDFHQVKKMLLLK